MAMAAWTRRRWASNPSGSEVRSSLNQLRQTGDGQSQAATDYQLPITASAVAIGDLDGDGRADLAVYGTDGHSGAVRIMLQSHCVPGQFGSPQPLP